MGIHVEARFSGFTPPRALTVGDTVPIPQVQITDETPKASTYIPHLDGTGFTEITAEKQTRRLRDRVRRRETPAVTISTRELAPLPAELGGRTVYVAGEPTTMDAVSRTLVEALQEGVDHHTYGPPQSKGYYEKTPTGRVAIHQGKTVRVYGHIVPASRIGS